MRHAFFAADLGATSGRTILGIFTPDGLELEEVNRFPNHLIQVGNHFHWDIYELYRNILEGLRRASGMADIVSIGIDTWGCDFALVGRDGGLLRLPYSYRDPHTAGAADIYFSRVPRSEVYGLTGIQVMDFNSLFQLDTLRRSSDSALEAAEKILFIPDALGYMLTGQTVTEYTVATTAQIVNALSRRLDPMILETLGLDEGKFGRFVYPGELVGVLSPALQRLTGLGEVPVVAVAGHDTASAVAAVPATVPGFAYLSSGTWSLMGLELPDPVIDGTTESLNITNEGGVEGTIRLLKNICGMWLLERCRERWSGASYDELIAGASSSEPFRSLINPDAPDFANPENMEEAIRAYCRRTGQPAPGTRGQVVRCIFESLALRYRQVLDNLCGLSPHPIEVLHIIGGGSRNALLNQWTANAVGLRVVAGPSEATAIGNIAIQAIAAGMADDISSMRKLISRSVPLGTCLPEDGAAWQAGYEKFLRHTIS